MTSSGLQSLPWRGPSTSGAPRPDLPFPPEQLPMWRGGRPLKQWRWVGGFSEELMFCALDVHVAWMHSSWWAVWLRKEGRLFGGKYFLRSPVKLAPGSVAVRTRTGAIDVAWSETEGVETVSRHGEQYIWTRKQGGVPGAGIVTVDGVRHRFEGHLIVDDSAGYHARVTNWRWAAGVGVAEGGQAVAWNFTDGIHDSESASERTVWVDGHPHEVRVLQIPENLSAVRFGDGSSLQFHPEVWRSHHDRKIVVDSYYEQPFGRFEGDLPGVGPLASGMGVMELHRVKW